jgi:hypothetical protein
VRKAFRHFGLGVRTFDTPQFEHSDIPPIPGSILRISQADIDLLSAETYAAKTGKSAQSADAVQHVEKSRDDFYKRPVSYVDSAWTVWSRVENLENEPAYRILVGIIDKLLEICIRPYIESGFPVYCHCSGEPHAIVLFGIVSYDDRSVYYLNDDQFGPYLGSRTLLLTSKETFQHQSFTSTATGGSEIQQHSSSNGSRSEPAAIESLDESLKQDKDVERGISNFVVATPPRLTLSPMGALAAAYRMVANLMAKGTATKDYSPIDYFEFRLVIMLGLDYKRDRRSQFNAGTHEHAFFSSFHLAEWVILVEATMRQPDTKEDGVAYEFVYDGTSEDSNPLLQLTRVRANIAGLHPHGEPTLTTFNVTRSVLPPVTLPDKASK